MSGKRILIRGGTVVLPHAEVQTNLLIVDGKIAAVDAAANSAADEVVEAAGLTILPGAIDDQVHFREPGLTHKEDIESGSAACAAGGVTTFLEMPNTQPPAIDQAGVEWKFSRAAEVSHVNFGFYIGATEDNLDALRTARNVPGIKIFIGSSTGSLLVDNQAALERIFAETTLPICAHCEDETIVRANKARLGENVTVADHSRVRDVEAAVVSASRAIDLAKRHSHRFHLLHVSSAAELPLLIDAKPYITSEVCLHHVFFNTDDYATLGTLVQMNPSLKSSRDAAELWKALLKGRVQVIATDHAPHTLEEKAKPYPQSPSGLPAVENSLPLMLDQAHRGNCTLLQIASWMSDAPARVWGLVGKGRIEVGYDADLAIVDMQRARTIKNEEQFTKCKWSPWAGKTLQGVPVRTIVGGQTVFQDGKLIEGTRGSRVRCDHARGGFWSTPDGIGV